MTPKQRKSGQPITAHRLFPALVALWFAALFGLGSFAVQPHLLERIVAATPLPALVPATAPPLGITARLLVALAMTGLGFGLGLVVALRLRPRAEAAPRRHTPRARASTESSLRPRNRDSHPDAPVCTPLILSDDLIAEGVGQTAPRAPAPSFADEAPVIEATWIDVAEPVDPPMQAAASDTPIAAEAAQPVASPPLQAIPAPIVPGAPRSPIAMASLDSLGLVQLIERLALAIAERQALKDAARNDAQAAEAAPQADDSLPPRVDAAFDRPGTHAPLFQRAVSGAFPAGDADQRGADIEDGAEHDDATGPDDGTDGGGTIIPSPYSPLVEKPGHRSGHSIVSLRPARFGPAHLDDTAHRPETAPEPDESEDDEDFAIPRFLGRAPFASAPAPVADDDDLPEPPVPEDRYSSLVDMQPPLPRPDYLHQAFIRVDDADGDGSDGVEPVVVFPGQGPFARPTPAPTQASPAIPHAFLPDPAPTSDLAPDPASDPAGADRALRAALATLQRMTAKG